MIIQKVEFFSQGELCRGLYYSLDGRVSNYHIVMAHGLAGIKEMRLTAYAERFVKKGYSILVFDYRGFGDSDGEPRQLLRVKMQYQDWLAAVDYLSVRGVTLNRMILWGTSLSCGYIIELANAKDEFAALICQVPFTSGISSAGAVGLRSMFKLFCSAVKDVSLSLIGRPPYYIGASGYPGSNALMSKGGDFEAYTALSPKGKVVDQRVAARFVFDLIGYNPGKKLGNFTTLSFIQVARYDRVTPSQSSIKFCEKAKNVTLKVYDVGHFDPYTEPVFDDFINDQIDYLQSVLDVGPTSY